MFVMAAFASFDFILLLLDLYYLYYYLLLLPTVGPLLEFYLYRNVLILTIAVLISLVYFQPWTHFKHCKQVKENVNGLGVSNNTECWYHPHTVSVLYIIQVQIFKPFNGGRASYCTATNLSRGGGGHSLIWAIRGRAAG